MQEIEIRTVIELRDKEQIISNILSEGYILKKSVLQHDLMFDREDASLFRGGYKIRLRTEGSSKEITYKGSLLGSKQVSRRLEINIPVNESSEEDISDFFTALGYPMLFQIKKKREVYIKDDIQISFDEWPIIGVIVEIEGKESLIIELAKQIAPKYSFGNRRLKDFFLEVMTQKNKSFEDLKSDYYEETKFDLGRIEFIL